MDAAGQAVADAGVLVLGNPGADLLVGRADARQRAVPDGVLGRGQLDAEHSVTVKPELDGIVASIDFAISLGTPMFAVNAR